MASSYELFDHTADMGVRVHAESLADLIPPATEGLYATIGEVTADLKKAAAFSFEATAGDAALLLRDYLAEVLILFERARRRIVTFDRITFNDDQLTVAAQAAAIDESSSDLRREVKAVTYHELTIRPSDRGLEATFIVDI